MKPLRSLWLLFFLAIYISPFLNHPLSAAEKKKTAVLDFQSADISASGLMILSELVRNEVAKSREFELLESGQMYQVIKDKKIDTAGLINSKFARAMGMALGVDKIMTGSIGILGKLYIVNIWLIDVDTGRIEKHETEEYVGPIEQIRVPVKTAAQRILSIQGIELKETVINITSKPEGAGVYINGLFEGNTPLRYSVKKPGEYAVKVWSPGFEPWKQIAEVKLYKTTFIEAKLLKQEKEDDSPDRKNLIQDGRPLFISFMTLYSVYVTDGALYAFGVNSKRPYYGGALVAAPVAFFITLRATSDSYMNNARLSMIVSGALWGSLWGISALGIVNPDAREGREEKSNIGTRAAVGVSILGGSICTVGSILFTRDQRISSGRVGLINLGSLMGSLLGLGIPYLFNVQDSRIYFGSMLGGGIVAGMYGIIATRNYDSTQELVPQKTGAVISSDGERTAFSFPVETILNLAAFYLLNKEQHFDGRYERMEPLYRLPLYTMTF